MIGDGLDMRLAVESALLAMFIPRKRWSPQLKDRRKTRDIFQSHHRVSACQPHNKAVHHMSLDISHVMVATDALQNVDGAFSLAPKKSGKSSRMPSRGQWTAIEHQSCSGPVVHRLDSRDMVRHTLVALVRK